MHFLHYDNAKPHLKIFVHYLRHPIWQSPYANADKDGPHHADDVIPLMVHLPVLHINTAPTPEYPDAQ